MFKKIFFAIFVISTVLLTVSSFTMIKQDAQSSGGKKPVIYANNFKTLVNEGDEINCRKISDMGVVIYFSTEMKKMDEFKVELHRFGTDEDAMVASKTFIPSSKEFQKKYAEKDSLKLKLLVPDTDFNKSDFEVNTLIFPVNSEVNETICHYKEKHNNFYLAIKGYNKTGKKNKFGEDEYDKGTELTPRSIVFNNWEDKKKK